MKKVLLCIFCPRWTVVWNDYGAWKHYSSRNTRCFYIILFSKIRNKYKLITKGDDAKSHSQYNIALQKLAEFNKSLL